MLRPLHNASLSDIHPAQHIRHFRPNSTKQRNYRHLHTEIASFSDKPASNNTDKTANKRSPLASFLHPHPETRAETGSFFSKTQGAQHKQNRTNRSQPHTKQHQKHNAAPLIVKTRLEPQSVKQKAPPYHTQTPLSGKKNKRFQTLSTVFSNNFVQTYNISVKQGKNDSIFV